jgi:hypothetical protein
VNRCFGRPALASASARIAQTGSNVAQWFYLRNCARDASYILVYTYIYYFIQVYTRIDSFISVYTYIYYFNQVCTRIYLYVLRIYLYIRLNTLPRDLPRNLSSDFHWDSVSGLVLFLKHNAIVYQAMYFFLESNSIVYQAIYANKRDKEDFLSLSAF